MSWRGSLTSPDRDHGGGGGGRTGRVEPTTHLEHLDHDVAAPQKLAVHVELRDRGPIAECFDCVWVWVGEANHSDARMTMKQRDYEFDEGPLP